MDRNEIGDGAGAFEEAARGRLPRVLRTHDVVRPVGAEHRDEAMALCARDMSANVFVAARIVEGCLTSQPGSLLGVRRRGELVGLCWVAANVVPVGLDDAGRAAVAARIRRMRRQCASIFGPSEQVVGLWEHLRDSWGPPRAVRERQPLMVTETPPGDLGVAVDERVRFARPDEVDIVLPAAAHMFTEEIGYPPYSGSDRGYRAVISDLIAQHRTLVRVDDGRVVFKADVGSLAAGTAQVQGVWLHPGLRGRGMATPAMAAATEMILEAMAREVSLYVNDYNVAARATYLRCGYRAVGSFTTVLL